jgi:hypothetical protein
MNEQIKTLSTNSAKSERWKCKAKNKNKRGFLKSLEKPYIKFFLIYGFTWK